MVQARRQDFLRGGGIQRTLGTGNRARKVSGTQGTSNEYTDQMMPEEQVSGEGCGREGRLGYLRLHFEHFEILDISQTFNLQM